MMAFSLDHHFLRNTHPQQAGPYLRKVAQCKQFSITTISQELLHATANESLPPRVYKLWLCACPDTTAIVLGLRQTHSLLIRTAAIRAFRRWFRTAKCVDVWRDVGGTEGILTMLATFSIDHVSEFSKQLGRCNNSQARKDERQSLVTDLMYSLASRFFPESAKLSNPDHRPLLDSYAKLVPTCTPEARDAWIGVKDLPEPNFEHLMQADTEHYQRQCLKKAGAGDDDIWKYSELLVSIPPGGCSDDPNLPKSILFAAELLETVGPLDETSTKTVLKFGGAFRTIIRRLARRNVSNGRALRVVRLMSNRAKDCVLQYLYWHMNTLDDYREYLKDIVRLWGRDPDEFEHILSTMLRKSKVVNMTNIIATMSMVSMDKRHRLLRWLMLDQYDVDINKLSKASLEQIRIPFKLFTLLPKDEARNFLEYLVALDSSTAWLSGTRTMPLIHSVNTQLDAMRCLLLEDHENRLSEASSKVKAYQRLAEKERDPVVRVKCVIASASMSVTSGSLDLLRETLTWARRYNRDPNISDLYDVGSVISDSDTVSLLSGIPKIPTEDGDPNAIATNIRKGNEIALLLLETAVMCQTEPSFYVNHWTTVQHLFVDIVECRLERVKRLQSKLGLSDDEIYEIVWKHTLESLLAAERLGIDDENEALQFNDMRGPLAVWEMWANELEVANPSLPTLHFIDELAKQRDLLWQKHRPSVHPGVAALQAPWPRGLPVQALLQIDIDAHLSDTLLPFIRERARDTVFVSPEKGLSPIPEDRDTKAAIGCFVNDYSKALEIYISWCDKQEKQRKIQEAWQYATTSLSKDRFSPLEASRYWEPVFAEAGILLSASMLDYPERPLPKLPRLDPQEDRSEWNPDAGPHPANVQEQALDVSCLDCMTTPVVGKGIFDKFEKPKPTIEPLDFPGFWDLERFGSVIPPDAEEAFLASALLLADTLSQAESKILSAPFPGENTRLPAAYLDSDFVDQQRSFENIPFKLLDNTPPSLLEKLTAALIPKLSGPRNPPPATIRWAFKTLKLLAWSDKPGLAIRHIVHVVINLPDHSSWHRVLLHPGVLNRLSKEQSKDLLTGLADAINKKNSERAQAIAFRQSSSGDSELQTKLPSKAFVKVTTVKMLAQLLSHAPFIDETFSIDVLVKLLRESTHRDIRAAIVNSLIVIVSATKDHRIEEAVLSTLESEAVPIAAQLSEGHFMTEDDWTKCEDDGKLPEDDLNTPICTSLLSYVKQKRTDKSKTRELVQRLVLPLIEKTSAIGQRWMAALLHLNNLADLATDIPRAFGAHELLDTMLREFPSHMPASCFRDLQELVLYFHDPPKGLQELKDVPLIHVSKLFGAQSWISDNASLLTYLQIPDVLEKADFATAEDAEANNLLTPAQLQAFERLMIDKLLDKYDERIEVWTSLTTRYSPPLRFKESILDRWHTYCRPLIHFMVERVETTRTTEWQRNPLRRPARLPDTFKLRLWLLTFPSRPLRTGPEHDARREAFAIELRDLIGELAASGRPYHARFAQVIEVAKLCYEQEWVALASRFGAVDQEQEAREFTIEELLLVEFADSLLRVREPKDCPGLREVNEMLGSRWSRCVDEDVRDRGLALKRSLRVRKDYCM